MFDLSILIPSRNEMFLAKTINDILANIEGNTEIITVCDGSWPDPPVEDDPRVTMIYRSQSIGQRAACNEAARLSKAKFVMKCDAHCAFDKGFDVKLMAEFPYEWTVIPRMYNLHAFDWQCDKCGKRVYQGPYPSSCADCDNKENFSMVVVWEPRRNCRSDFMRFDSDLHFQYWGEFRKRPEAKGDISDTMSLLGACWMLHRERYWELGGMDEKHGSWGQMGTELSCKTWLSGGRLVVNKRTWFSHLFRTQPGFGFPYPNPGIGKARKRSHELWLGNSWEGAKYPLSWLVKKFAPIPGWENSPLSGDIAELKEVPEEISEEKLTSRESMSSSFKESKIAPVFLSDVTRDVIYYSDGRLDEFLNEAVRRQLHRCRSFETGNAPKDRFQRIVPVVLKPMENLDWLSGDLAIVLPLERGILTMFRQILQGLLVSRADVVFLCEHDVLYHPSHFDFTPARRDVFYYNTNVWKVRSTDGHCMRTEFCQQTSGLCASRALMVEHYTNRVARAEREVKWDKNIGFEPGTHHLPRGIDNYTAESWESAFPNIDIRHDKNLTPSRWSPEQFRNKRYIKGWIEADEIPGWGRTGGCFREFLEGVSIGQIPESGDRLG